MNTNTLLVNTASKAEALLQSFTVRVYAWMTGMFLLTGLASLVSQKLHVVRWFTAHPVTFVVCLAIELGIVMGYLSSRKDGNAKPANLATGIGLLASYSVLNGVTFSVVLSHYKPTTVLVSFLASALVFGSATVFGLLTKRNLMSLGGYLFTGLLGLLAAMIMSLFLHSRVIDFVISCVAVVIFTALAAYDASVIKECAKEDSSTLSALDCALSVYLDFVNLFLHLLRIFGGSSNSSN